MRILGPLFGLVVVTALVAFVAGVLTRSRVLAIAGTWVVIEFSVLFALYEDIADSSSSDVPEVINVPPLLAIAIAPVVLLTAYISVRSVERMREERRS